VNTALCALVLGVAFWRQTTPNTANNPQRAAMNKQI